MLWLDESSDRRSETRWGCEPGSKLDPGTCRHHRLLLPLREARIGNALQPGAPLARQRGAGHGCSVRAVLRAGYPQATGGGLFTDARGGRPAGEGGTELRDDDRGSAGAGRLAHRGGLHACGDGKHRGVLETDLQLL